MSRKLALLIGFVVAVVSVGAALVSTGGNEANAAIKVRQIYMSAVEWKGSSNVSKEAFPTSPLPSGGGYERFEPGNAELAGQASGTWAIETYRFDTAVVAACKGERVVLKIFGVNAKSHEITIPDFDKDFTVYRGQLATSVFKVKETGIFPIICITHKPSHTADLIVLDC